MTTAANVELEKEVTTWVTRNEQDPSEKTRAVVGLAKQFREGLRELNADPGTSYAKDVAGQAAHDARQVPQIQKVTHAVRGGF